MLWRNFYLLIGPTLTCTKHTPYMLFSIYNAENEALFDVGMRKGRRMKQKEAGIGPYLKRNGGTVHPGVNNAAAVIRWRCRVKWKDYGSKVLWEMRTMQTGLSLKNVKQ